MTKKPAYVPEIKFNNEIQRIVHQLGETVSSNLNNPKINLLILNLSIWLPVTCVKGNKLFYVPVTGGESLRILVLHQKWHVRGQENDILQSKLRRHQFNFSDYGPADVVFGKMEIKIKL